MQSIFLALITYLGWGTGDIFGAVASRKIGSTSTTFWAGVMGFGLSTFYIPFALGDFHYTWSLLLLNLILGVLFVTGNAAINTGFALSNTSVVGTIGASFSAVVVVLSVIFLGDKINVSQILCIGLIFLGVILSSLDFKAIKGINIIKDKGIRFAFMAMVCWAIYFTFVKVLTKQVGWFWPNYISLSLFLGLLIFMKIRGMKLETITKNGAFWPIVAAVILLRGAEFIFNYAISNGLTAIVAPIAGSYSTLFAVLSYFVFKDPIKRQQILGILITVAGIVALSFLSV